MNPRRLSRREQAFESGQLSSSNPACCNSLHQSQQLSDCSKPLAASAIDADCLDTPENAFDDSSEKQLEHEFHNDSTEYKQYGIEYQYEGSRWILEIWATSFEDAEARVRRLSYSKVLGELKASIPVPAKPLSWIKRLIHGWF